MTERLRQSQLIAPFGVGSLYVMSNGVSAIAAGLDAWFSTGDGRPLDRDPYELVEPRLAGPRGILGVDKLFSPPDHREDAAPDHNWLRVPFHRFPQWHVCTGCRRLKRLNLQDQRGNATHARADCGAPDLRPRTRCKLVQVRFVAMCEHGHLQDFPWSQWVHRRPDALPEGTHPLELRSRGGTGLSSLYVSCRGAGCNAKPRSLGGITAAVRGPNQGNDSVLSTTLLAGDAVYACRGQRPWLGEADGAGEGCHGHLRASLRNATNLYFSVVRSAIHVPAEGGLDLPQALLDALSCAAIVKITWTMLGANEGAARHIHACRVELAPYTVEQVRAALERLFGGAADAPAPEADKQDPLITDRSPEFLRQELDVLSAKCTRKALLVRPAQVDEYTAPILGQPVRHWFAGISLVDRLRETRALVGFTRMNPDDGADPAALRARLRRQSEHADKHNSWLPAYEVYGEGLLFRLNEDAVVSWEARLAADQGTGAQRVRTLEKALERMTNRGWTPPSPITPRFVMVHTLAHMVINRLVFECGYSSASLKERLYVAPPDHEAGPMAAMLIYTAAGDSEGTMGGLVRMGRSGLMEPLIERALAQARWCSADPVCSEMADTGGQGPGACNLAACHACALLPETACTEFNRFLDRGLVVGSVSAPDIGYFGA